MASKLTVQPGGKTFDFDRVLADVPEAEATAQTTEAAVAAGDLIRRVRSRKAISQARLAKRIGTTQPHLSEIERGIGESGATVGMLSRLLRALDDELIIQSRTEQALWVAERIDAAETAIGELTERLGREAPGVVGVLVSPTGAIVAEAIDFTQGVPASQLRSAQEARVRRQLAYNLIQQHCSALIVRVIDTYEPEEFMRRLVRDQGFTLRLIPIGHTEEEP